MKAEKQKGVSASSTRHNYQNKIGHDATPRDRMEYLLNCCSPKFHDGQPSVEFLHCGFPKPASYYAVLGVLLQGLSGDTK